jgi:LPS O-antigen subunit length determinant protein (WzzB/FepE family)
VLLRAKKRIVATVLAFAVVGLAVSFLMPQKWTSQAIVTSADKSQWNSLREMLMDIQVLDIDVKVSRDEVFNLFIKKFQSQSLLEDYMKSSPYVMQQLKGAEMDEFSLHRAIVGMADRMKAQDNNAVKGGDKAAFSSWTLSFTAPGAADAQTVLQGYIKYVSDIVETETLQNIRNTIKLQTSMEKERLELDRVRLTNIHNAKLQRLNYSLEVANAAGIKKPVFSHGQAVKDDPDYSVALGADGIAQKLQIEESFKDATALNADFQNREFHLAKLQALVIKDITFEPFQYQLSPSLPVKKDGPGKSLIIILAAMVGGLIACGSVLLREAMLSRAPLPEPVLE